MRPIDADALKSVFTEKSTEAVCGAELCKAIISRICDAPTVDAIPVSFLLKLQETAVNDEAREIINEIIARWEIERKEE